jgi:NADP-dependent aldehyde dehydrogenase
VRAKALTDVADALDANIEELVEIADLETGLGKPRLTGEVGRTTFQIRQFADAISRGEFIAPLVDAAVDAPLPVGHPELVRTTVAIGPVVVFGASNFPFAFSVLGGDTASALAAGCTVIAKAHPAHPQTSQKVFEIAASNLPKGVLALVHGVEAGKSLIHDHRITAGAFTGSRGGGRALFDLATQRKVPIPFYGELGSVNPVVELEGGATDPVAFATAYLDSLLLGNGQFCTNPSILFVPEGCTVIPEIKLQIVEREGGVFLSEATKALHDKNRSLLATLIDGEVFTGKSSATSGFYSAPQVFIAPIKSVKAEALNVEAFGPTGLVLTFANVDELITTLQSMEGALTSTIFAQVDNSDVARVSKTLASMSGRVSFNAWPTGVAVTAGQNHGSPYPASTSPLTTSVGLSAITRFLRPVTFQSFPKSIQSSIITNHEGK